ncbi:MAG: hypothetical protein U9R02_06105, partial [Thermodesulfobacteriota bacterium]|nr:hypothetical protein [Thermodesulfobacteriota bacterium]
LLRIKDSRKSSTYPRVCLWFSQTLMHQDLGTYLRNKSLNLGYIIHILIHNLFTHELPGQECAYYQVKPRKFLEAGH